MDKLMYVVMLNNGKDMNVTSGDVEPLVLLNEYIRNDLPSPDD